MHLEVPYAPVSGQMPWTDGVGCWYLPGWGRARLCGCVVGSAGRAMHTGALSGLERHDAAQ